MLQALIANSSCHCVSQITQNELKTHGAILNVLKQIAASIGGGIVSGRVVDFEHEYDGEHVLSFDAFAALITHEPDLKTQYKLMESMNTCIQLMKTKRLLAEAKAEEQMTARRARAAAALDVPVRPPSPALLAAGQGQGGE
jgi:pyruvate-formate lyase